MYVYRKMISHVLNTGTRKPNRTGIDTLSTFNFNYELVWDAAMENNRDPNQYLLNKGDISGPAYAMPLLTTKDVSWKNIVAEMLWFLSGEPTIQILKDHGCKFWDAWADENGRVPMAYGEQWRRFPVHEMRPLGDGNLLRAPELNDQIKWVLDELRKNPMSRRLVVSAWAPALAQNAKLPPCHMLFAFNVQNVEESLDDQIARARGDLQGRPEALSDQIVDNLIARYKGSPDGQKRLREALDKAGYPAKTEQRLCLHLTQRSADLALGVPYNIASYSLLLLIFSHLTGIKPGIFAHTLLDLHIYTSKPDGSMAEYDHIPGLQEQNTRTPKDLPTLTISPDIKELSDIEALMKPGVTTEQILEAFKLDNYEPHPAIKFKVAV